MAIRVQPYQVWWGQLPNFIAESTLRRIFANWLRGQGLTALEEVATPAGIMDIVTHEAIYEMKLVLSRVNIFTAVGQLSIYRQAHASHLRGVVVGFAHTSDRIDLLRVYAEYLDIGIWALNPDGLNKPTIDALHAEYLWGRCNKVLRELRVVLEKAGTERLKHYTEGKLTPQEMRVALQPLYQQEAELMRLLAIACRDILWACEPCYSKDSLQQINSHLISWLPQNRMPPNKLSEYAHLEFMLMDCLES